MMTDTEATAPQDKREKTPEQEAHRQVTRALTKALSRLEGGTPEEQRARRSENKEKYSSDARALVKSLTKEGISFTYDETASAKAKRIAKRESQEGDDESADESAEG